MKEIMFDLLPLFKTLHIVGAVGWFGGLFYLVRIFVYHREAIDRPSPQKEILIAQYQIMEGRVYKIICLSGMIITWVFGTLMLFTHGLEWLKSNNWIHAKLLFVVLLTGYQHYCKSIIKKLAKESKALSSFGFRLFNEVPSIMLLAIVLLAVYKNSINYGKAIGGIFIFGLLIFLIARWYKSKRTLS